MDMEQIKAFYDRTGNTLTVWFGEPQDEYICEETGDEVSVPPAERVACRVWPSQRRRTVT